MKIFFLLAAVTAALLVGSLSAAAAAKRVGGDDHTVGSILTEELFDAMLKHRNSHLCPARNFYTYDAFINASSAFPEFGSTGDLDTRKREIAAFLGQTSHETYGGWQKNKGGWPFAPDGPYTWGYCIKEEVDAWNDYCVYDPAWPCARGKRYYGRGPMQLSYNYNYGLAGKDLGLDLLEDPDVVANDPVISFETAIWFWMKPQSPKPSCHDVMIGEWTPTPWDVKAGRLPGYGVTTNIINGGPECGFGWSPSQADRIGFYKRYCELLGVDPGYNLDCNHQTPYQYGLTQQAK